MEAEHEEMKAMVGIRDFQEYEKNPFMGEAAREVGLVTKEKITRWRTGSGEFMTKLDELGDTVFLGTRKKVDADEFTKIYHRKIKSMLDLSNKAIKLIIYIASKLEKNGLQIDFDIDDCISTCDFSRATIYRLLAELLKYNVIARSSKRNYVYFINPVVMFNGQRLKVFEEYYTDEAELMHDLLKLEGISAPALPDMHSIGRSSWGEDNDNE